MVWKEGDGSLKVAGGRGLELLTVVWEVKLSVPYSRPAMPVGHPISKASTYQAPRQDANYLAPKALEPFPSFSFWKENGQINSLKPLKPPFFNGRAVCIISL